LRIFLVRHGDAGSRKTWLGDDVQRPLEEAGERQAEALVGILEGREVTRVFSSPYLRCTQSVEPLALSRRLPVEHRPELAEGASKDDVEALLRDVGKAEGVVLSTHGDIIESLLGEESEKGSTWVLERRGEELVPLEYLPPPG
jgi:8-oxo-(d)GTP phosphatase